MKEPECGDVFLEWEEDRWAFSHLVGRSLGLDDLQSRHWEQFWTSTAGTRELDSFFDFEDLYKSRVVKAAVLRASAYAKLVAF